MSGVVQSNFTQCTSWIWRTNVVQNFLFHQT